MGLLKFLRRHSSKSSSSSTNSSHSQLSPSSPLSNYSTHDAFPLYQDNHNNSSGNMSPTIIAAVQEPSKSEKVDGRTTGFPEPLSPDRNTTLPHPTADTSPNATIIAPDISPRNSFSHHRSRSFLSRKESYKSHHQRNNASQEIKNGTVTTLPMPVNGENGLYEGIVYADEREDGVGRGKGSGEESGGSLKGVESEEREREREDGLMEGSEEGERKRGLLRKLRH